MYTVSELVRILGLATENQVRNRIEAVRDLLAADIRRGPNNQILLTEQGLTVLRSLQELCESGHTLKEAANILRYKADSQVITEAERSHKTGRNLEQGWREFVEHLAEEVRELQRRVAALEARVQGGIGQTPWWLRSRSGQ